MAIQNGQSSRAAPNPQASTVSIQKATVTQKARSSHKYKWPHTLR